jgi:hypothetical protein
MITTRQTVPLPFGLHRLFHLAASWLVLADMLAPWRNSRKLIVLGDGAVGKVRRAREYLAPPSYLPGLWIDCHAPHIHD